MSARDAVDGTTAIRQTNRVSGRVSETKGYSFLLADCRMFRLCELLTKTQVGFKGQRACGAGGSIKPGVERAKRAKPRGTHDKKNKARGAGDRNSSHPRFLCRPLRGLATLRDRCPGVRYAHPRLYAAGCSAASLSGYERRRLFTS